MKTVFTILVIATLLFCSGCNVVGFFFAETPSEKKVPAELDLNKFKEQKLLIFVDAHPNMRSATYITDFLSESLKLYILDKTKLKSDKIVPREMISYIKTQRSDFSRLSPVKIASLLDADIVLYVIIDNYELYAMSNTGYYNGKLSTRSMLFDVDSGDLLWPSTKAGRISKTAIEIQDVGQTAVNQRLTKSIVHNIVRCFYNCPQNQYRGNDAISDFGRDDW